MLDKKKKINEVKSNFTVPNSKFIHFLEELNNKENRAALAALRRGLQFEPGKCVEMYPYIIPWLSNVKGRWNTQMYYLIASLFAHHPMSKTKRSNIGDVYREIFKKKGNNTSIEKRFITLLKCNPEDLAFHMRQTISLAKSEKIPINWNELFFDLKRWPYESRFPPYEKWAQSFWKNPKEKNNKNK